MPRMIIRSERPESEAARDACASTCARSARGVNEARVSVTIPETVLESEVPFSASVELNVTLTSSG